MLNQLLNDFYFFFFRLKSLLATSVIKEVELELTLNLFAVIPFFCRRSFVLIQANTLFEPLHDFVSHF